ncbi:hypothetical protein [Streptosporangium sp. KLBMP 9127]|nr:hypothetical protein [Streptosporangium sp. KLBMP 9127]
MALLVDDNGAQKVGRSLVEAVAASLSGRQPRLTLTSLSPHVIQRAST